MTVSNHLAIVICTYNRSTSLLQTLESLYSCGYEGPEKVEILVVVNNCTDDTLSCLADFQNAHHSSHLMLSWIEESRAGKSAALNAAIAHDNSDVLCFIDDDQTVEEGFLCNALEGVRAYPNEAIYCGYIWPAWDGSEPAWVHTKGKYAIPIRPFPEFNMGEETFILTPKNRLPSGGNILVRRKVFETVGIFSMELGPTGHNLAGGEDQDFLKRAALHGFTIRYLPKVRQLHMLDAERMSTPYTLKKSFLRTRDNYLIRRADDRPHLYMFRKIIGHLFRSIFTFNHKRHLFYMVRLAASSGELAGSIEAMFSELRCKSKNIMSCKGSQWLSILSLLTVVFGVVAWFASGDSIWTGVFPALQSAGIVTLVLLIKSLTNFTQTGPQIRDEVVTHYKMYTFFALTRLCAWSFAIALYFSGIGVLVYYALITTFTKSWSPTLAVIAAFIGIVSAFMTQFLRKLRYNPGLLVASMHYRMSRLYKLWHWVTPGLLTTLQWVVFLSAGLLLAASSRELVSHDQLNNLLALWSITLFVIGVIVLSCWEPLVHISNKARQRKKNTLPNIIMIGSDTLRADRLGAMGYHRNLTPNIDALAASGTLFKNCYVPCARTAPSLISMLTGTWPHTHGVRDNFSSNKEAQLKVDTLPLMLKRSGYQTAVVSDWCGSDMGKFSFGFDHEDLPEDQWNLKYLIRQGPKDLRLFVSLFTHNRLGRLLFPEVYYVGGVPLTKPMGCRARELVSCLSENNKPFFLNIFYSSSHPPFASEWPWYNCFVKPDYKGESKFAMARLTDPFDIIRRQGQPKKEFDLDQIIDLYDGCVASFDDEVGKMLTHLEDSGLKENTIIVVYSDHGMELFEHETWGQGNSAIGEASPKIPLVICDPRFKHGKEIEEIVRSVDIAPTLVDLAGVNQSKHFDGVSLAEYICDEQATSDLAAFNETGIWLTSLPGMPEDHLSYPDITNILEVPDKKTGTFAIKEEFAKRIILAKDRMIRKGRWKLTYQPLTNGISWQLFDLHNDPGCKENVIDQHKEITASLKVELLEWINSDDSTQKLSTAG